MQFQLISSVVAFAARSTVPHCVAHLPPRLNALPYAARSLPHLTALLCNVHPLPSIDCPTVWRIPYFIFNFAHLFVWEGVDRDCHSKCVRVPAPPSLPPQTQRAQLCCLSSYFFLNYDKKTRVAGVALFGWSRSRFLTMTISMTTTI